MGILGSGVKSNVLNPGKRSYVCSAVALMKCYYLNINIPGNKKKKSILYIKGMNAAVEPKVGQITDSY